uniref:Uncharacterized protein n=1 Tax=Kalanchoe fedtschenkoi TaxID=63787 RepID=A0A7N0VF92_KALFE
MTGILCCFCCYFHSTHMCTWDEPYGVWFKFEAVIIVGLDLVFIMNASVAGWEWKCFESQRCCSQRFDFKFYSSDTLMDIVSVFCLWQYDV